MITPSFLSTLFFALAAAAQTVEQKAPFSQLRFSKRVSSSLYNIANLDRLRANAIKGFNNFEVINSSAENVGIAYIASVGVGLPPTTYDLQVDTGSSNTWLGLGKDYVKTNTSQKTSNLVGVSYGSGSDSSFFTGTEYIDQVTIAPGLVIPKQSIGVADRAFGFPSVFDGILGVGPTNLTIGTLFPDSTSTIPTVTDNSFAEGTIAEKVLSISFEPITTTSVTMDGELTWGGVDSSKFIGDITYAPITSTANSSHFWGIDASMTYGDIPLLSSTAGIVDTGTTLIMISTDAFNSYQNATGGVFDQDTQLLKITSAQYANLKSIFVHVNGVPFELTPNAQIWPRALNAAIRGTPDGIYLIVIDNGHKSGSGLDYILGQLFLERFYSVYDTAQSRVGLARTTFTDATTN